MATLKMKALLYSIVGVITALIVLIVCVFGFALGAFYSASYALLFGVFFAALARTVFHLATDDNTAEMWQVSIYLFAACGAWLGCILCTSWGWLFGWMAIMVGMLFMAFGSRFIKTFVEEIKEILSPLEQMKRNTRFKFINDDPEKGEDKTRPLCRVNGENLTCEEADARGFGAIAATGIEYLKGIVKKTEEKETKEEK